MYLNQVQLAESFGVSEKVIEDWVHNEGLPHVPDRGRWLFDRAVVAHWAAAHGFTARAGFLASENGFLTASLTLSTMLRNGGVWRDVCPVSVVEIINGVLARLPGISPAVRALLAQRLHARGGINWAPVGHGFALPHFSSRVTLGPGAGVLVLLLLKDSLPLGETPPDGQPVTRLFFFVPPSPRAHLDTLARLSRAVSGETLRQAVERGASDDEILHALIACETRPIAADQPGSAQ